VREIWISPTDAPDAESFDALLLSLIAEDSLAIHLSGSFKTKGVYRWGRHASRNLGKNWTVDGDAEISLDPGAISVVDGQPLFCLAGPAHSVREITTVGNHSALADMWRAERKMLRTGSVLLYGDGAIDGVPLKNFGALRAPGQPKEVSSETFIIEIVGSGSITNCPFSDYDPASSDDQVTVRRIMGSENGEMITDKPCLMEGNRTEASGDNQVQAHTIYWARNGTVRKNITRGVKVGYYGDWGVTKGIEIYENDFEALDHGVQLKLSPGQDFSHEDYTIGPNKIISRGANVSIDTVGPPTATRYIRGIRIHSSLSLENFGGEVMRYGEELSKRKGCNPFR
jgi:hypothetical protein